MLCKHDWSHAGYDAEELYFEKLNRELIQRLQTELAGQKDKELQEKPLAQVIPFPSRNQNTSSEKKNAA